MTTAAACPSQTLAAHVLAQDLTATLRRFRFRLDSEKMLQQQVAEALTGAGHVVDREVRLAAGDIIDFTIGTVGIEAKIKGQRRAIWRQCERYCRHETIGALILVTNAAMGLPVESAGKPVFVVSLGRGWL